MPLGSKKKLTLEPILFIQFLLIQSIDFVL